MLKLNAGKVALRGLERLKAGLPLSEAQARAIRQLQKQAQPAGTSGADRVAKSIAKRHEVEGEFVYKISKDRKACEFDLQKFNETYRTHAFYLPESDDHRQEIVTIQNIALKGGSLAWASPRGDGKTERAKAGMLWALLYGHSRFGLIVGPKALHGKQLLAEIVQELADNVRLAKDWPEICLPIRAGFGRPQAVGYLTKHGVPLRMVINAQKLVFPFYDKAKVQLGGTVLIGAGVTAAIKGMRHVTSDGRTIRPDFVLLDDIQDKKSAMSVPATARTLSLIRADIKKMCGPDKELRCLLSATVVRKGDAADTLLDNKKHPEWRGVRKKMVYEWPKRADLWEQYKLLRQQGMLDGDNGKAGNSFYADNRVAMDDGAQVGWSHRIVPEKGEVSAIQNAYNILIDDGEEAFFAECQNEPIEVWQADVKLTGDDVLHRLNGLQPGEIPEETQILTGFIDVNDHALGWAMGAWHRKANALTGAIVGYGEWAREGNGRVGDTFRADKIWDEKHPSPEGKEVAFWNALNGLAQWIFTPGRWQRAGQSVQPNLVLIDSGYTLAKGDTTVYRWIANYCRSGGGNVGYSRGWPARTFRVEKSSEAGNTEVVKISRENWWRFERYKPLENVFGLPHDSEFHDRAMQQAWLLPPGAPGSLTLNGTKAEEHLTFAQQIAGVKLIEFKPSDAAMISGLYVWARTPSVRNEMSDCVRGCRLAGLYRLGDSGSDVVPVLQPATAAPVTTQQVRRPAVRQRQPAVSTLPGWENVR
jgi:hypothetical protein